MKHENVTEIPTNIKHLVDEGSLQFLVPPDGACAINAGAAHLFREPKYGPELRLVLNNHLADRWSIYKDHVSFPYVRKVGVQGNFVRFETGEEERFCEFLRSKESAYLWSDNLDLQLMCNLYQMQIKIITTKGSEDPHPIVSWLCPNPELKKFQLLPAGPVPIMTLIHYDEKHFNLVISKDHELFKTGTLSQSLDEEEENPENDDKEPESCEDEKQVEILKKYEETVALIQTLYQKIESLEKQLACKKDDTHENDENESISEVSILKNKNFGFRRIGPQVEAIKNKPEVKYTCPLCDYVSESKWHLDVHLKKHELKNSSCTYCEKKFKTEDRLNLRVKTTHEKELKYNCNDCSYQAHTREELNKHFDVTHVGHSIFCHTCGKGFSLKRDLMRHRKTDHANMIKKCKYFSRGNCDFEDDFCWWKHEREVNENDVEEDGNKLVFQNAQSSNHPPIMEKILGIVERLMEKVNMLEGGKMKI